MPKKNPQICEDCNSYHYVYVIIQASAPEETDVSLFLPSLSHSWASSACTLVTFRLGGVHYSQSSGGRCF